MNNYETSQLSMETAEGQEKVLALLQKMVQEISDKDIKISNLTQKYEVLQEQLSLLPVLESENASLRSTLSDAQAQLEADSAEIRKSEETMKVLRQQMDSMQEKAWEKYIDDCSALYDGQQTLLDAASALEDADKKIRNMTERLENLTSKNAQLRRQLLSEQQTMRRAMTILSDLSSTNDRLLKALEADRGIGDLLAEERDEWERICEERGWIERAWKTWKSMLNPNSQSVDTLSGVLADSADP